MRLFATYSLKKNPLRIHLAASTNGMSEKYFGLICGMNISARVIGPDTSCGKKMMYRKTLVSVGGAAFCRVRSTSRLML